MSGQLEGGHSHNRGGGGGGGGEEEEEEGDEGRGDDRGNLHGGEKTITPADDRNVPALCAYALCAYVLFNEEAASALLSPRTACSPGSDVRGSGAWRECEGQVLLIAWQSC